MKITTDIWFAAYLDGLGIEIKKYETIRRGKGSFHYDFTDKQWKQFKLDFNNSPEFEYKNRVEKVKNLVY